MGGFNSCRQTSVKIGGPLKRATPNSSAPQFTFEYRAEHGEGFARSEWNEVSLNLTLSARRSTELLLVQNTGGGFDHDD